MVLPTLLCRSSVGCIKLHWNSRFSHFRFLLYCSCFTPSQLPSILNYLFIFFEFGSFSLTAYSTVFIAVTIHDLYDIDRSLPFRGSQV